ncbi:AAA family ATPase [Clostridium senegalense]|nr:AAA family ATPase [Clostridium senegalense]
MTGNVMIIITGAPATGKTTLSNELAKKYGLPKINKDEIKELLFKSLEVKDSKWTTELGIASFELTYFF